MLLCISVATLKIFFPLPTTKILLCGERMNFLFAQEAEISITHFGLPPNSQGLAQGHI